MEVVEGITARLWVNWQRVFAKAWELGEGKGSTDNGGRLWLGAARDEDEREANGAGECVGQALAFF